jgi:prepilin-type N-terminal cleavage/methylation domain-containing protein
MFSSTKSQAGLTLIEMMIALLIGLIITAGVLTIFVSNIKSSTENTKMIRMNQQLRSTMSFITDELKRAGYSGDSTNTTFTKQLNFYSDSDQACLRYAYDVNGNGVMDTKPKTDPDTGSVSEVDSEIYAFQFKDGAIRWGENITSENCDGGVWQDITDSNIVQITSFTVENKINDATSPPDKPINMVSTAASTIKVPQFAVILSGKVSIPPNDASRTIKAFIRVRNDCAEGGDCD